jgi:hypothetical protein
MKFLAGMKNYGQKFHFDITAEISRNKNRPLGDLGSMLWSQFSAIFANFGEKNGVFLKSHVMIKFLHNLALFWVKNANFLPNFFGENIFKIITSVPGRRPLPTMELRFSIVIFQI